MCAAIKKKSFIKKNLKKKFKKKIILRNLLMQTLYSFVFFKFGPENMKKPPSKVGHNRPPDFFLCTGPAAQTAQKQKSLTTKRT